MINWVLGSGEAYLSTSRDIGDSVITCEILRKEHEEFELNARVREHLLFYIYFFSRVKISILWRFARKRSTTINDILQNECPVIVFTSNS